MFVHLLIGAVSKRGGGGGTSKRLESAVDRFLSRSLSSSYRSFEIGRFIARFASSILFSDDSKLEKERKILKS